MVVSMTAVGPLGVGGTTMFSVVLGVSGRSSAGRVAGVVCRGLGGVLPWTVAERRLGKGGRGAEEGGDESEGSRAHCMYRINADGLPEVRTRRVACAGVSEVQG